MQYQYPDTNKTSPRCLLPVMTDNGLSRGHCRVVPKNCSVINKDTYSHLSEHPIKHSVLLDVTFLHLYTYYTHKLTLQCRSDEAALKVCPHVISGPVTSGSLIRDLNLHLDFSKPVSGQCLLLNALYK